MKLCPICNARPARPRGKYCSQTCSDQARRGDWQRANEKRNHPQGFTPRPKQATPGQVKAMSAIERVVRDAWAKADKWERAIIEGNNSEIDFDFNP